MTVTSRRAFMSRSLALGCSLAASPLVTPVTMASGPWDARLVVIILRGAMDGLDTVRPLGDPGFAGLRDGIPEAGPDLDGFFGLHPALSGLMPLWEKGELGFAHAVSTPYRDKRSHFDGQDILEAGTGPDAAGQARDGWLNRMLQAMPGVTSETAYAVGREDMLLLTGDAPVANWSPEAALALSPQAQRLLERVMHDDPLFRDSIDEAIALSRAEVMEMTGGEDLDAGAMMNAMQDNMQPTREADRVGSIVRFAAERLRQESRIAAFSLNGFDTHARQDRTLPRALDPLQEAVLTLRQELGDVWDKTAVLAMTEFGRTARWNGSGGTDHGTAGAMLLAGGAVRGGRVLADWPGLSEPDLYQRRDLMPTRDVRAFAGWAMRDLFGMDRGVIERTIFPGLELGSDPKLTL
ncbi:DUF1501 domain-containing protein [Roseovarius atlanticus]|uniref:DUF1501 domain-containing protein n=1 Tax=Roseovarius atlanticus TaxID=1641875 RepID=UPI001C954EAE|nr:DUF1501 domain-containing protein [Roseovarius atlanticus]MBY5990188.1 DUF1501 domain-containing protein [Roseovarius atlanticus]MBY6126734.1 DUF1501 domain-containing protein [Roseovarius atlanticus]MBY6151227.1 DUF1501 domain-containing protein [Roseovarius atlanticus]